MSEQNRNPRIREMYDGKFTLMFGAILALYTALAVVIGVYGPRTLGEEAMRILPIVMLVGAAVALVVFIRCLVCRVCIDERGVEVNNPFSGSTCFTWGELRTAAVVRLTIGGKQSSRIIVLSSLEPQDVLTNKALVGGKGISRHEHVRITHSKARQECVEHYLRMKLPEIDV